MLHTLNDCLPNKIIIDNLLIDNLKGKTSYLGQKPPHPWDLYTTNVHVPHTYHKNSYTPNTNSAIYSINSYI